VCVCVCVRVRVCDKAAQTKPAAQAQP